MGIYTDSNGTTYNINIDGGDLQMLQNNPDFHFCWMSENYQIDDEHSDYYEDRVEDNETHRVFKNQITIIGFAVLVVGLIWKIGLLFVPSLILISGIGRKLGVKNIMFCL